MACTGTRFYNFTRDYLFQISLEIRYNDKRLRHNPQTKPNILTFSLIPIHDKEIMIFYYLKKN